MNEIETTQVINVDDEIQKMEEINLIEKVAECLQCNCLPCRCRAKSLIDGTIEKMETSQTWVNNEKVATVGKLTASAYTDRIMDLSLMVAEYRSQNRLRERRIKKKSS